MSFIDEKMRLSKMEPAPEIHVFSDFTRAINDARSRYKILNNERSAKFLESYIDNILMNEKIKVISFDVFDTFLLRNNKPEAERYLEMSDLALKMLKKRFGEDLFRHLSKVDLCLSRALGMVATYRTRPLKEGCGEGHIQEVYSMQRHVLSLPAEADDVLLEAEIEYETQNLQLNPLFLRLARRFREAGGKVILVSDMYLPADVIEKILSNLIDEKPYDHLFSSADTIVSKRCGKIFAYIEDVISVKGKYILHIGDSWQGDYLQPRKSGWHALYFPISRNELQSREKRLHKFIREMERLGYDVREWAKI